MTKFHYIVEMQSRIGGRRENQDSCNFQDTKYGLLAVVCDGMGGAKGGKTASMIAVSTIFESVNNSNLEGAAEVLTEAINKANLAVYNTGMMNSELRGMGTTVVALLLNEEKATTAHVGDSRIYQIRDGQKAFRTFDHSMVFELVKRGRITEEQARLSAESNVILRALGISDTVEIEINDNLPYLKRDRFLLCSDGICGAVNEQTMCKLIRYRPSVVETLDNMTNVIDNIGIEEGGKHDNLTAILVKVNSNSKKDVNMSKKAKLIILGLFILFLLSFAMNLIMAFKSDLFEKSSSLSISVVPSEKSNTSDGE